MGHTIVLVGSDWVTEIEVLGPLVVRAPDGERDPGGDIPRLILALLVCKVGQVVTYHSLIEDIWGDNPPATARKTVQVHVSNLRKRLGDCVPLQTVSSGYRLEGDGLRIDSRDFEAGAEQARGLAGSNPAAAGSLYGRVLRLWSGPAFADVAENRAIAPEATRLEELRLQAIERRIECELAQGRHAEAHADLGALCDRHPYRENLHALRMLALYRDGRQTEALRHYEQTRRRLADDLGVTPSSVLRELQQQILEQSKELDLDVGGSDVAAGAAERGYELGESLGPRNGGTVYAGVQASLGRPVAVEVHKTPFSEPPFLARHEHPYLVSVFDAWTDGAHSYVAMPLLERTLAQAVESGDIDESEVPGWIGQIAEALEHLHSLGAGHGAVAGSNVLLDSSGNALLTDAVIAPRGDGVHQADAVALALLARDLLADDSPLAARLETQVRGNWADLSPASVAAVLC